VRPRLFELPRCPACKGRLACGQFSAGAEPDEVAEGVLHCACGRSYPIIDTSPRMPPDVWALFRDFTERHRERLGAEAPPGPAGASSRLSSPRPTVPELGRSPSRLSEGNRRPAATLTAPSAILLGSGGGFRL
jgi:uncharacterized protein YbaR (Trm112 family)